MFNLQGTRRFRRNIAIITNCLSLVKNFFQVFSKLSDGSVCYQQLLEDITSALVCQEVFSASLQTYVGRRRVFASAATLVGYHIRLILSRLFFRDSTVHLETLASFHRAVRNSLLRIPETVGNVNRFFHFFGYQLLVFLMTFSLAFCFANKGALFTAAVPCYTINIVSAQPQYCPTQEGSF